MFLTFDDTHDRVIFRNEKLHSPDWKNQTQIAMDFNFWQNSGSLGQYVLQNNPSRGWPQKKNQDSQWCWSIIGVVRDSATWVFPTSKHDSMTP